MKLRLLLPLLLVLSMASLALGERAAPQDQRLGQCVVRVQTPTGMGSGTIVRAKPTVVVTARHVILGDDGGVEEPVIVVAIDGTAYQAAVSYVAEDADLALLETESEIADAFAVNLGEPTRIAFAAGWGGGRLAIVDGRGRELHGLDYVGGGVQPGDSGGPVINDRGQLCGVVWGTGANEPCFAADRITPELREILLTQYCPGGACPGGQCPPQPPTWNPFAPRRPSAPARPPQAPRPQAPAPRPRLVPAPPERAPDADPACACGPQLAALDGRIDDLEEIAGKYKSALVAVDRRLKGIEDLAAKYATKDDLRPLEEQIDAASDTAEQADGRAGQIAERLREYARRTDVAQDLQVTREESAGHFEAIRKFIEARLARGQSVSTWTNIAGALALHFGWGGPLGLGIGVAGWLISRRLRRRFRSRESEEDDQPAQKKKPEPSWNPGRVPPPAAPVDEQVAASAATTSKKVRVERVGNNETQSTVVVGGRQSIDRTVIIETPPPPQHVVDRGQQFVPYQAPNARLEALERAMAEYVRKYPAAASVFETVNTYARQFEAGKPGN